MKTRVLVSIMIAVILSVTAMSTITAQGGNQGIVKSIVKAPIVPDGTVAGATTDFVITLDTSLDPDIPGRTLLEGNQIKIALPDDFENTGLFPIADVGSSPDCVPGNFQCNTGVLLQGWPQHPIRPPSQKYSLSMEGTNTIVFTALEDLTPSTPLEPGIKQIHLILNGFVNPNPGKYDVVVTAETGPDGEMEMGSGAIHIIPNPRASINITSAFNLGTPNTIYQDANAGELTPLPYDFLLWDSNGEPFEGLTIKPTNGGKGPKSLAGRIVHGNKVVGQVFIDAPKGATGYSVFAEDASFLINSPVSGLPTARMTAKFQSGSAQGDYMLTFSINGGNSVQTFVNVN